MKIERILLFTLLVALIFIATIVLFVFKTFAPSQHDNTPQFTQPVKPVSTSTPTSTTSPTPVAADDHTPLGDCTVLKASEAQGKQYEKGSLLVTFPNSVQFDDAVDIVAVVGAKADISSDAETTYEAHHWLTVNVPRGEEFKWQCLLEGADGVKKANLNFTFNLRQ